MHFHQGFALTFYVRVPNAFIAPALVLHDPATPPDLRNDDEAVHLLPGHTYTLRVTPSQLGADAKVLELDADERQCLVPEEADRLSIYNRFVLHLHLD